MTAPEFRAPADGDAGGPQSQANDGENDERVFTQSELNSFLAKQKREIEGKFQGFDEIRDKANKFDELNEASKTEIQKANEAATQFRSQFEAAQAELDWRDTLLMRQKLAATKGLDSKLWDRVKGETEEEITADIDDLLTLSVARPKTGGLRSGATPTDAATAKERAAAAFRGIRDARA